MTSKERTAAILNLVSTGLPPLLAAAPLPDFDEYVDGPPLRTDDSEFSIYVSDETDSVSEHDYSLIFQCQINGGDLSNEYHSVIMDYLRGNLTPEVVGFQSRIKLSADLWPIDPNSGTAFIFYEVIFQRELDDCSDF